MKPVIHVISNGKQDLPTVERILSLIGREVDVFHIREKQRTAREIGQWIEALTKKGIPLRNLSINDRMDVALAYKTGSIQLAYHSLPLPLARTLRLPDQKIGVSVHSVEEACQAQAGGADYVLFGHIFPSGCKPGKPPRGLQALQAVVQSVKIPVIALGGITPDNCVDTLATGCAGIAIMSAIMESEDPTYVLGLFRKIFVQQQEEKQR